MAIEWNYNYDRTKTRFTGLSTDTKPDRAALGSTFLETDTRDLYEYVGEGNWIITDKEYGKTGDFDDAGRESINSIFGDKIVGIRKPSIASQFVYGIDSNSVLTTVVGSASYSIDNSMLKLNTGTTTNSSIFIKTKKALRYIPGFQAYIHYTFLLSTSKVGTYKFSGLGDEYNHFSLGHDEDGDFCIRYRRDSVDTFIKQSEFNKDKVDGSGYSGFDLNPEYGNVYRISYGFLGFANINFEVLDSSNSWIVMHTIKYVNSHMQTHITNTYLPIFADLSNGDTVEDVYLYSGSLEAGIVDGSNTNVTTRDFSAKADLIATSTNTPIIIFHNKSTFASKVNMIPSLLSLITSSSEGAQNVNITLYKLPLSDITSATWIDVKTNVSTMEYAITPTLNTANISNWEFLLPLNLAKSDSKIIDPVSFELLLYPDEYAVFIGNGNSVVNTAIRWNELF